MSWEALLDAAEFMLKKDFPQQQLSEEIDGNDEGFVQKNCSGKHLKFDLFSSSIPKKKRGSVREFGMIKAEEIRPKEDDLKRKHNLVSMMPEEYASSLKLPKFSFTNDFPRHASSSDNCVLNKSIKLANHCMPRGATLKRKKILEEDEDYVVRTKIKKRILNPPKVLPDELSRKITEMGGTNPILLITKSLTVTDCNDSQNRLTMPLSQIAADFLNKDEKAHLCGRKSDGKPNEISVKLIKPNLEEVKNINIKIWNMNSNVYALTNPWKNVVSENKFTEGSLIQVWSFRVEGELRLALVNLTK